ncbi:MAG: DNA polymerase III subunit epsilon [Rhodospirillaceae bacterium]|nr:DNA polymerase III subunit epsilon [Magnetovibrio sp.]MAY68580.1 DNA polymerase III subunit epsilon [Rhodospirillaceae bacterium]|tara:strand:- start:1124 stop:1744 length:621 start_codon:yes stop_codon:yes gene_type:complete
MTIERPKYPNTIFAVDVESNGCTPPEIIELSVVKIDSGAVEWPPSTWKIKPLHSIQERATSIHGITDAEVAQSPSLQFVKDDIQSLIQHRSIVAHNAHVDFKLLKLSLPDWQPAAVYDTLRLVRVVAPELPSFKLSSLVSRFGITEKLMRHGLFQAHRACYDAMAAAYLFLALVEQARSKGIGIDQVLRISAMAVNGEKPKQGQLL